jgi:hypothetical protein
VTPWAMRAEKDEETAISLIASARVEDLCSKLYLGLKSACQGHAVLSQYCELLDTEWLRDRDRLPPGRAVMQLIHKYNIRCEDDAAQGILAELFATTLSEKSKLASWLSAMTALVPRLTQQMKQPATDQLLLSAYKKALDADRHWFDVQFISTFNQCSGDKTVNNWRWLHTQAEKTLAKTHNLEMEEQTIAAAKTASGGKQPAAASSVTPADGQTKKQKNKAQKPAAPALDIAALLAKLVAGQVPAAPSAPAALGKTKPCFNYAKHGTCKDGKSCQYSHDKAIIDLHKAAEKKRLASSSSGASQGATPPGSRSPRSAAPASNASAGGGSGASKKVRYCHFFGTAKGCNSGKHCKFSHDAPPKKSTSSTPSVILPAAAALSTATLDSLAAAIHAVPAFAKTKNNRVISFF